MKRRKKTFDDVPTSRAEIILRNARAIKENVNPPDEGLRRSTRQKTANRRLFDVDTSTPKCSQRKPAFRRLALSPIHGNLPAPTADLVVAAGASAYALDTVSTEPVHDVPTEPVNDVQGATASTGDLVVAAGASADALDTASTEPVYIALPCASACSVINSLVLPEAIMNIPLDASCLLHISYLDNYESVSANPVCIESLCVSQEVVADDVLLPAVQTQLSADTTESAAHQQSKATRLNSAKRTTKVVPAKRKQPSSSRKKVSVQTPKTPNVVVCAIPDASDDSDLPSDNEVDEYHVSCPQRTARRAVVDDSEARKKPKEKKRYCWKDDNLQKTAESVEFRGTLDFDANMRTPVEYFRYFFTNEVFEMIAQQSALYSTQQRPNKPVRISVVDIQQFIGVCLYMSLIRLAYTRNYWSQEFRISQIADVMTLNRFEEIKRVLHLSDNSVPAFDKLQKIRPLVEHLRQQYSSVAMEECLSVDEQIVPFKGRSCLRQYNPRKPHRWGYKIFVLCGVSGYAYDFECYSGHADNVMRSDEEDLGASANVVLRVSRSVPSNMNHKLYFDNYFTSVELQVCLAKRGILSVGTVRPNRIPQCCLKAENELKKQGRGSYDEKVAITEEVSVSSVRWYDNKAVSTLSTFVGALPVSSCTRWNGKTKSHEEVSCPAVIKTYNKHMGGVDLMDSLIGLYRIKLRSKKWYHRLFFHLVDMSVINAWLLYRRQCAANGTVATDKQLSLHQFKASVARALCKQNAPPVTRAFTSSSAVVPTTSQSLSQRTRSYTVLDSDDAAVPHKRKKVSERPYVEERYDGFGHLPTMTAKKQRCKQENCKGCSRVMCVKCNVHLCLFSGKDCFVSFHTA